MAPLRALRSVCACRNSLSDFWYYLSKAPDRLFRGKRFGTDFGPKIPLSNSIRALEWRYSRSGKLLGMMRVIPDSLKPFLGGATGSSRLLRARLRTRRGLPLQLVWDRLYPRPTPVCTRQSTG